MKDVLNAVKRIVRGRCASCQGTSYVLREKRMNRETYNEAKVVLEEITRSLKEGNLSEEEKQKLELSKAQLSGQLLRIWWPFDRTRRSIMIVLFLVGLYGLIEGSNHYLWAWLAFILFSPRIVGEISFYLGRIYGFLR